MAEGYTWEDWAFVNERADGEPIQEVIDMVDHDCNAAPTGQLWLPPWQVDTGARCVADFDDSLFE
jgi:hypothetical protein